MSAMFGPINATSSSWLSELANTTNYEALTTDQIGLISGKATDDRRAILEFDLSSFQGTAGSVASAILSVYGGSVPASIGTVYCRRLTQAFVADEATWDDYESGVAWASNGGDYALSGEQVISPAAGAVEVDIRDIVRDALTNGYSTLYLIVMTEGTSDSTAWAISSADNSTPSQRPSLEITYKTKKVAALNPVILNV